MNESRVATAIVGRAPFILGGNETNIARQLYIAIAPLLLGKLRYWDVRYFVPRGHKCKVFLPGLSCAAVLMMIVKKTTL